MAQRGKFLTGWIVFFGSAVFLASFLLVFDPGLKTSLGDLPGWFNSFVIGLLIGRLIALAAIWNFRRWGVYLLFALECLELAMGLFVFSGALNSSRLLLGVPSFVILIAIWILALRPKWPEFR